MVLRKLKEKLRKDPDSFLEKAFGVIHVGANVGQERSLYAQNDLEVLWIEPIPEVFEILTANLEEFPKQRALPGLVTDEDGKDYELHIANNRGSSSILDLKLHKEIWPDIHYEKTITVPGVTLNTLLEKEQIDLNKYNALVMDTQGSELLVLQGAIPILHHFKFIKTEVADFEAYSGCCQLPEVSAFMKRFGFREYSRRVMIEGREGNRYYDIVYERVKQP